MEGFITRKLYASQTREARYLFSSQCLYGMDGCSMTCREQARKSSNGYEHEDSGEETHGIVGAYLEQQASYYARESK